MTDLITCLSTGKGSLEYVCKLINKDSWDKCFVITHESFAGLISPSEKVEVIVVDFSKPSPLVISEIVSKLKGKINSIEAALNIVSGTGKEHMAIISSVLKLGLGLRFVVLTKKGIKEI